MLVPSRNVIPSWTPRSWARSSSRSHTPRWAQRMNICAARDQGPSSAGMARHLAPFACRQTIAEIVRRKSFGAVLPLGRHASISGSRSIHAPSVRIAPSSFQEEQNARHHKQFKLEQALVDSNSEAVVQCALSVTSSFDAHLTAAGLVIDPTASLGFLEASAALAASALDKSRDAAQQSLDEIAARG